MCSSSCFVSHASVSTTSDQSSQTYAENGAATWQTQIVDFMPYLLMVKNPEWPNHHHNLITTISGHVQPLQKNSLKSTHIFE